MDDQGKFVLQGLVDGGSYRLSIDNPQMHTFEPGDTPFTPDADQQIDLGTIRPRG